MNYRKKSMPGWFCLIAIFSIALTASAFDFNRLPYQMVEDSYRTYDQTTPELTFTNNGNIHVVYEDERTGTTHAYGMTLMDNGTLSPSYRAYQGSDFDPHISPFILPSTFSSDWCYCATANTISTFVGCDLGRLDMAALPAAPGTLDLDSVTMAIPSFTSMDMVHGGGYLFYVYSNDGSGNLVFNRYNEVGGWDGEVEITLTNDQYTPSLAIDDDGYLYVVYEEFMFSTEYYVYARRSQLAYDIGNWHDARYVDWSSAGGSPGYEPSIAVDGAYGNGDLKVAVNWKFTGSTASIAHSADSMVDWTATTPVSFPGPTAASEMLVLGTNFTGPDCAYGSDGKLYVTWADDRDGSYELYGNIATDGLTMTTANEEKLANDMVGIHGKPSIATGSTARDVAIAFCQHDGSDITPFLLADRPSFFDSCDQDPSTTGFWDSYAGVTTYDGDYTSPPRSYQFASARGALSHDYGVVEQQGLISFQFNDTMDLTENFYVAVENNNSRGVIRMLGVRNETTTANYSYSFDGSVWTDTGIPRSNGWQEVEILVDDTGLTMNIGGSSSPVTDPGFTSFTSIEMQGGGSGGYYLVDDIRVEVNALAAPLPFPASSAISLMICLLVTGILILRRR